MEILITAIIVSLIIYLIITLLFVRYWAKIDARLEPGDSEVKCFRIINSYYIVAEFTKGNVSVFLAKINF